MALPIFTTAEDVKAIVSYLGTKATGATIKDATAVISAKVLDGRKLSAYQSWGLVTKNGERLDLTSKGREFARSSPPQQSAILRELVGEIPAYRSALEWAYHQKRAEATNTDIAAHWHNHHKTALGDSGEETIKDMAVCFFHLAQLAELGTLKIGRRGQSTRFTFTPEKLEELAKSGPSVPPWQETKQTDDAAKSQNGANVQMTRAMPPSPNESNAQVTPAQKAEKVRVFISHSKNMGIVEQIQTMLGLADFESEVAEAEETAAIPVPQKVLSAMRRCQAGIICVTADEGHKDAKSDYIINENVLIEIGAAFVLYDQRVVLVWDKRISIPSNLQGLYRCEFSGDELSWNTGMKLMKAISSFKKA